MTSEARKATLGPAVQLFILSRNRKSFCREAVMSALSQDYSNYEVIVSDNSADEDVAEMIKKEFPSVTLVRRRPCLPALGHFNRLIEEARAPYMVLFHDDDILESCYLSRMIRQFSQHSDIAAIGCNACLILDERRTPEPLMGNFKGICVIKRPIDLVKPYMGRSLVDPAPFPGYMYRTEKIKGLALNFDNGGKHSDVSFLCQMLTRSPILWIDECLFNYRIHGGNDSRHESIGDRLSWLRFIQRTTGVSRRSRAIVDYKFIYWRRWLQQNSAGHRWYEFWNATSNQRHSVVRIFVLSHGFRLALSRVDFWRRTWRLLRRKWLYR